MVRGSCRALLATSPTSSLTPPTLSPQDKFYFTVRLSQYFKPMLLSYDDIRDTPFLGSRTSNMLSESTIKVKNLLLTILRVPFYRNGNPITELCCNQLHDYPVRLIVLTRNPFLPKKL